MTFPAFTIEADTQTYSYDFAGRVTQANNRYAQVSRGYYTNGWLGTATQKVREYNGTSFSTHVYTLSYGYDRNGRRIRLTHPTQLKPSNAGPTEYRYNPGARSIRSSDRLPGGPCRSSGSPTTLRAAWTASAIRTASAKCIGTTRRGGWSASGVCGCYPRARAAGTTA